jgi:glycosyltransferase involved in cell wall biosynthesis
MRVAFNAWFWSAATTGSGQYTRRLIQALAQLPEDQRPEMLALVPDALPEGERRRVRQWGATLIAHPAPQSNLGKVWWEQVTAPRLARRARADLLHVPYWAPPYIARPPRTIVTIHDLIPVLLPAYRGHAFVRLYTALVRATTPRARLILTDSAASREDILTHLSLPAARVRAVPLAVDRAYSPEAAADDDAVRQRLRLPEQYILYLGGFDRRKNLRTLLAAFEIVARAQERAHLVIAGRLPKADTAFTPDPRRLARELGLQTRGANSPVHFLGFVNEADKPALLRGARAFAYPSTYEGFGYPCLEAIACGAPVVGSAAASIPEVVGPAGVLLSPDDHEGMAGALLQLLTDDAFHAQLRAAASEHARRFSWTRTARETLAAYHAALG